MSNYEVSVREAKFKAIDKDRLVHVGDHRVYRVFKHADTDEYWTTCMGDFVTHHTENPLPRN